MRTVSEMVGVSKATVSRALNNPEKVLPATRAKILQAIEESGYRPNEMARNFSSGKSFTVVVIVTDITNQFYSRIIKGIEHEAQKLGYSVLLGDTNDEVKREQAYAEMLLTNRADGLIHLHHRFPFSSQSTPKAKRIPMVSICIPPSGPYQFPHVVIDNFAASREVANHLLSLGHTKIAAISGQDEGQLTKDRMGGLKRVLQENGIPFRDDWYIKSLYSKSGGEEAALTLLEMEDRPTAMFCFNDDIAIGAMKAIKSHGLKVPEDISVVGFDNIEICEYLDPPLTTIDQPAVEMGARGMQILYRLMNDKPVDELAEFKPFKLLVRKSTAKAKS